MTKWLPNFRSPVLLKSQNFFWSRRKCLIHSTVKKNWLIISSKKKVTAWNFAGSLIYEVVQKLTKKALVHFTFECRSHKVQNADGDKLTPEFSEPNVFEVTKCFQSRRKYFIHLLEKKWLITNSKKCECLKLSRFTILCCSVTNYKKNLIRFIFERHTHKVQNTECDKMTQ